MKKVAYQQVSITIIKELVKTYPIRPCIARNTRNDKQNDNSNGRKFMADVVVHYQTNKKRPNYLLSINEKVETNVFPHFDTYHIDLFGY